jgi:hypothetical protein
MDVVCAFAASWAEVAFFLLCQCRNHIVNKQSQWVNRVKSKSTDLKLSNQCFMCHSFMLLM